ncbi:ABC transporter permease [Rhodobacteraceae bacterium 2CG4]|uniref:ABC transporter permease n=2 Tax=Halovulum marinum TaxID=2662447 RepID=A0A6L5Z3J0_9RHOB|nr:ABC transporter permease [Halovulum marinum]
MRRPELPLLAVTLTAVLALIVFAIANGLNPVLLTVSIMIAATPLMLAALGELVVEKSGVLNLGVEGMMIIGAIAGFAVAVETGSPMLGVVAAALAGAALALVFGVLTQMLLSNQVATGLALTLFGLGLAALIGQPYAGIKPPAFPRLDFFLSDIPVIGRVLFGHDLMLYLAFALLAAVWLFLSRTRAGLILRAVGESHDAAHALGYNVIGIRLAAIAFGGACAGLGGAALSLVRVPQWTEGMTAGAGWIALAIVVFATWKPGRVALGAYLFGGVTILQLNFQAARITPLWLLALALLLLAVNASVRRWQQGRPVAPVLGWWAATAATAALAVVWAPSIQSQYLSMTPYICTILVLVVMSGNRLRASLAAPASLGRVFHRTG